MSTYNNIMSPVRKRCPKRQVKTFTDPTYQYINKSLRICYQHYYVTFVVAFEIDALVPSIHLRINIILPKRVSIKSPRSFQNLITTKSNS